MVTRGPRRRRPRASKGEPLLGSSSILAVGGAEDKTSKRQILERFVQEAGGKQARIAILPTASSIPEERATFYSHVFHQIGCAEAFHVPIVTRADADTEEHARRIEQASGIFLTGGDQTRLVSVLRESAAFEAIRTRLHEGGVLAGTSAGASAFSATMIVGGQGGLQLKRDAVTLGEGLGVITRLIIDQHFSQRDRLGRLLSAIAQQPDRLGVGIDEDTAIVYYGNGKLEVLGSGQVFVVDARKAVERGPATGTFTLTGVTLHVLTHGDRFNVITRKLLGEEN